MKCACEVTINKPLQEVWDYTNNPDNLKLWLNDFVKYEHLTGDMSAPKIGDTSNHTYNQNGKDFVMKEEIVEYDPPNHLKLVMTSKWFDMDIVNNFDAIDENTTKLFASAASTRVGLLMKFFMIFMPNSKMQKDHEKQINKLKELIEAN